MTVFFVVASGLGVAAFTSQVSEQPLPLEILNSVRFPGDAKIVSKWAVRLKSSAINPKDMMGNVFLLISSPEIILEAPVEQKLLKSLSLESESVKVKA